MSEIGPEMGAPSEGGGSASEQLSEEAKARFAGAAAAMIALQREEKRSKKRDSRVARTIIQFLNDDRYAHLFVLISRLVARDCPSIFILAILSLINDDALKVVEEYLQESGQTTPVQTPDDGTQLTKAGDLEGATNQVLIQWITRMQMVLSLDTQTILLKLMVDERNIDGTVLQLTTFVLQEFFRTPAGGNRDVPFEQLQGLSVSFLQAVFEPFMDRIDKKLLQKPKKDNAEDDDDE
jgi:hypothetical protein